MNESLSRSPFYEIRHAIQDNPILLAEDFTETNYNVYIYEQIRKSKYVTVGTYEGIEGDRRMGYCNFIYFDVSF
jgi:hypothetical protein